MGVLFGGPEIVTDSLAFVLDPSIARCYPGTGTRITPLVANRVLGATYTGVLAASSVFTTGNYGGITFSPSGTFGGNITFQINPSLKLESGSDYTIDVWLKFNSLNAISGADTICYFANAAFQRYGLTNKLFISNQIGPQANLNPSYVIAYNYTTSDVITTGVIQHYTVSLSSSSFFVNFYLNGQVVANTGGPTPVYNNLPNPTNMNPFLIGKTSYTINDNPAFYGGYDSYGSMTLYNMKLYSKALSAAEVLQNHNAEKGRYGI